MKQGIIIALFVLITTLWACEPAVTFTSPQPANSKDLSVFPHRLQGKYMSLADSSTLLITGKMMVRLYNLEYRIKPGEQDSSIKITGDTLIDLDNNKKYALMQDADTLLKHVLYTDTLFSISHENVLRKLKTYYFLNTRYAAENWEVKKLQLRKGKLFVSSILTEKEVQNLENITETPQDTMPPYQFSPSKKQFKKFIRNHGFSDAEEFIRQK